MVVSIQKNCKKEMTSVATATPVVIAAARKDRQWTQEALAERAGVSRRMVQRVEKGNLKTEIGAVFELATLLKINLFGDERRDRLASAMEKAPLLPQRIREPNKDVKDDF